MLPRDAGTCEQCGETIDTRAPGNAQAASGWLVNRVNTKGNNYLALPQREQRYLCRHCLDQRRRGISYEQPPLFDLDKLGGSNG